MKRFIISHDQTVRDMTEEEIRHYMEYLEEKQRNDLWMKIRDKIEKSEKDP